MIWAIGHRPARRGRCRSSSYLLHGVLTAARSIVPSVREIAEVTAAASKDLDATALLLTTQDQVAQTIAGVADYGGSLDVIIDDAI